MDMKCVNGSQEETYIQMMIVVYKETTTLAYNYYGAFYVMDIN
jgi:hypothetical protein